MLVMGSAWMVLVEEVSRRFRERGLERGVGASVLVYRTAD